MTIEEKAKAYDEALKRADRVSKGKADDREPGITICEYIFPELKEDNNERIRKGLIKAVSRIFEGHKLFDTDVTREEALAWLENQEENKPTDKIEPRFHEGDWITNGHLTCKVLSVTGKFYELHLYNDDYCHFETDVQSVDKRYHLWTINDAKDGDVLVASDGSIFLFAGVVDCACKYYVALEADNHITINKDIKGGYWETSRVVYPATKEQRDLLFQKMKQAGYEWDSEKKELNEVELKKLDADKVIKWLNDQACQGWIEDVEVDKFIAKFKKRF